MKFSFLKNLLEEKAYFDQYSRALCDVEDLFKEGQRHGFCPYYLQKKIQVFFSHKENF